VVIFVIGTWVKGQGIVTGTILHCFIYHVCKNWKAVHVIMATIFYLALFIYGLKIGNAFYNNGRL